MTDSISIPSALQGDGSLFQRDKMSDIWGPKARLKILVICERLHDICF